MGKLLDADLEPWARGGRPRQLGLAIRLAIMGLHFEKFTFRTLAAHDQRDLAPG